MIVKIKSQEPKSRDNKGILQKGGDNNRWKHNKMAPYPWLS